MPKINIKPLSVNKCWQGRRFKTPDYQAYEQEFLYRLPKYKIPNTNLMIIAEVGYSNKASDIDNFLKPFLDILQKKYKFDDKNIYKLHLSKTITKKGEEYIYFEIIGL